MKEIIEEIEGMIEKNDILIVPKKGVCVEYDEEKKKSEQAK